MKNVVLGVAFHFSLSGNCKFVLEPCRGHNSKSTGHHGICCGLFWILYQKYHKWPSYNLEQVWHLKDFKTFSVITEEKSLQRMLSRHFIVQLQLLPTRWESCLIVSLIWIVVLKSAIDRVMIIQTSMLSYSLGSVVNLYFGVSVWADDRRINLHMPRGFNLLCYTAEGFSLAHCRLIPRINWFGEHKTFGGNTWNVTPRIYANFLQDYVDGIKEILMILRAREYFQERYSLTALTCANQPTSN